MISNADSLGIDPNRVIIGGGSAGGGLAAALALLVRDRGEVSVTHQVLTYPMIDDTRSTPSSQWTTWGWSPQSNSVGWRAYLGDLFETDGIPPYAAPARATDLSGLPPAYISVGTLDIFLDEDIDYARRLIEAGVPTELKLYPGGPHGFDTPRLNRDAELGQRAAADRKDYFRRADRIDSELSTRATALRHHMSFRVPRYFLGGAGVGSGVGSDRVRAAE